jgi:dipeptidyl aminopeptidase/acylaminoacyl peptidase
MRRKGIVLGLIMSTLCTEVGAQPPPVEAYGRLPAIGSVAISPDGKRAAIVVSARQPTNDASLDIGVFRVINLDDGTIEHTVAPPANTTLRSAGWADDSRPYYSVSASLDVAKFAFPLDMPRPGGPLATFQRLYVYSLATRTSTPLMGSKDFRGNTDLTELVAPITGDPGFGRMIAYFGVVTMGGAPLPKPTIFRVNLDNGSATPRTVGGALTREFLLDERGNLIARVDINERKDRWRLFVYDDGKNRLLLEDVSEMGLPLRLYSPLADGRLVAVDPHENGARDTVLALDWRTGEKTPLYKTEGSDVAPITDPRLYRTVGVRWTEDLPKQFFFDAQLQEIYSAVQPLFESGYATLSDWSQDRARVVIFGERAGDAGAFYIYETAIGKLRPLGLRYPALNTPESLGERRAIRYPARDGTSVPAYLTLPMGKEAKKLPMVLLVHGGPHARDTFTFDWWASFLASRGYAVLQPNFRGSTGYGYDWFNAGRGGWGDGVMQTDVEDGVAALIKTGMVDPSRVCIMGGSYGGYAALAGAVLTPDRYACAVSVNGLADPERLFNEAQRAGSRSRIAEWWRRSMGEDKDHLRKVSPMRHAQAIRVPVLILHGEQDTVVPVEQSRDMVAKLKGAGKSVRYVEMKGDDHWLSAAPTRTQMLQEIETFLNQHLAAKPQAATPTR